MEPDEKEREFQRNKELMILNAQIQRGNAMMFANINKANQAMNEKGQEKIFSINNGNNMQIPIGFPTFGMNNMGPYYMNMMNNYQKPEKK